MKKPFINPFQTSQGDLTFEVKVSLDTERAITLIVLMRIKPDSLSFESLCCPGKIDLRSIRQLTGSYKFSLFHVSSRPSGIVF